MSFDDVTASHSTASPQSEPVHAKRSRRVPLLLTAAAIAVGVAVTVPAVAHAETSPSASTASTATSTAPLGAEDILAMLDLLPAQDIVPLKDLEQLGDIIGTGIQTAHGEQVFYVVDCSPWANVPHGHIGSMTAVRDNDGHLTDHFLTYDGTGGPDRSAGFHALYVGGDSFIGFGYYAGPAERIAATVNGQLIEAHQARWSQDPNVVAVWFTNDQAADFRDITNITAYDADGQLLPAGDPVIYQG